MIDLSKWYWLADDGRVFTAERGIIVDDTDAAYLDFIAAGYAPAAWPRDGNGVQSDIILQAALAPHGLGISLLNYAEQKLYDKMEGGFALGEAFVATNPRLVAIILNARMAVTVDPLWTTPFVYDDGSVAELGQTEIMALSTALLDFQRDCLQTYCDVKLAINAGTITTKAEVDAAFAS